MCFRNVPFLNQQKGENCRGKYFMISVHERMLPTRRESYPQPPDHQSDEHPVEPPRPASMQTVRAILSENSGCLFSVFR